MAKKKIQTVIMERNKHHEAKRTLKSNSSHKYILMCMVTIFVLLIIGYIPGLVVLWKMKSGTSILVHTLPMTMIFLWISNAVHSLVYGALDQNFRKSLKLLISSRATVNPACNIEERAESQL